MSENGQPQRKQMSTDDLVDMLNKKIKDSFYENQKSVDTVINTYVNQLKTAAELLSKQDMERAIKDGEIQRLQTLLKKNNISFEKPASSAKTPNRKQKRAMKKSK